MVFGKRTFITIIATPGDRKFSITFDEPLERLLDER